MTSSPLSPSPHLNPPLTQHRLAPSTLLALSQFLEEQDQQTARFESLRRAASDAHASRSFSMADFSEDWQQSQFWYSSTTSATLAAALLHGLAENAVVALVSAPSVYVTIREWRRVGDARVPKGLKLRLLEFDKRFDVFADEFVLYDFKQPVGGGGVGELKGAVDAVLVDPPFLSPECQTKTALTVRYLLKPDAANTRVMVCTGERMLELILKLYRANNVAETTLEVEHTKGLSNEFRCYANFESAAWRLLEGER
ncbi:putative N6-adenine methyltransferase-domain-containing protein [Sphaerosporella brunnea]|uniref:Protein-lysine N-methyltransferase EFM5 n=1 Tax=Sphaerosporella brunnea TaxID=1250544 RepID=A0A5J5FA59_9PEZI|nr:putative N6-adenine methyltransferase-domain-containing protein [Sphaerosporella brunnea]